MAVALQIAIGIIGDYGDPYLPFGAILCIYAVLGGLPLAGLLIMTALYSRRSGARTFRWKSLSALRHLAAALPLSGILGVSARAIVSGAHRAHLPQQEMTAVLCYFAAGGMLYGLSVALKKLPKDKR